MDARRATTLLHGHQDGLLAHIGGVADLARAPSDDALVRLARARWEALRLIRAYQLFKHGELFDPLIACGTPDQRRLAERMKTRCIESVQRFVDHVTAWNMADAATEWDRYRAALTVLVKDMRAEILAERRDAETLLSGVAQIRTAPRAAA